MKILYTGAIKQGAEQLDPSKSLGHLVSGSVIPNDSLNNLFPSTSVISIQQKKRDIKMIAFLNDNGEDVLNLDFTFIIPTDSICKYKVAFVSPAIKTNGDSCFEEVQNPSALPYHASFQDVVDGTVLSIASLDDAAYLGMWIVREYDFESDDLAKKTCADWKLLSANPVTVNETEKFSFDLHYSLDSSVSQ